MNEPRGPRIHRGSLLWRISLALDESPTKIAEKLGVPLREFEALQHLWPGQVVPVNRDAMWSALDAHISQKIAGLIAVREEMTRQLRKARAKQVAERTRVLER